MGKAASAFFVCAALTTGQTAGAQGQDALYPGAQCAAFWLGFFDYAGRSPFLEQDMRDLERAERFLQIAKGLAPARAAEIDALIAEQRDDMALLAEAVIYGQDAPSRKVFETLTETCENFANTHSEPRDLK